MNLPLWLITFRDGDRHISRLTPEDLFEVLFRVRPETIIAVTRVA